MRRPALRAGFLAACLPGALVSTDDGGRPWRGRVRVGPYDTHELAIHPARPETLRVAAGDGYYESDDGGASWRAPADPTTAAFPGAASQATQRRRTTCAGSRWFAPDPGGRGSRKGTPFVRAVEGRSVVAVSRRTGYVTRHLWTAMLAAACSGNDAALDGMPVAQVAEAFLTPSEWRSNMDSPALWTGTTGEAWLLATGKWSHRLHVYDAATGTRLRTVGRRGGAAGEFRRPNGIAVSNDIVLVVERDNRRVQVLRLPDFTPVTSFGEGILRRPYGIAVLEHDSTVLDVFVTDDYRRFPGRTPPDHELGRRLHRFTVVMGAGRTSVRHVGAFGDTAGSGRLRRVESIALDPDGGVLLIADEESVDVKVYGTDGSFKGQVLGRGVLRYEPEGMALYACDAEDGYWVVTDQHETQNRFLVFHRASFRLLGAFAGTRVRNTDGIALTQRPIQAMAAGAMYAVHDDRAIAAFSWAAVAEALGLRADCAG